MTDDLVKRLECYADLNDAVFHPWVYKEAADRIKDLNFQIGLIRGAAAHAQKSYEQHLAVYRQKLDEKPPVWHDDIQSLQERDAIMTDRIEKLEAALREIADEENWGGDGCWAVESYPDEIARKALEGKDD